MTDTDIVDRARHVAKFGIPDFGNSKLLEALADEITRLRAEITAQAAVADERARCMRIAKSVIDPEADKSWNMAARLILETISGDCT